ncbi:MAG: hypothetical protein ACRCZF_05255, partial [Gemmataceae bacterium]
MPFVPMPGGKVLSVIAGVAGNEPRMVIWDDTTGKLVAQLPFGEELPIPTLGLTATRDGRYVMLFTTGRAVVIDLDMAGSIVLDKPTAPGPQGSAHLHQDGAWAEVTAPDGQIDIYPLRGGTPGNLRTGQGPVRVASWDPVKHHVALHGWPLVNGVARGPIQIWTTEAPFNRVHQLAGNYVSSPVFSRDGRWLFANSPGQLEVWDTTTWTLASRHQLTGAVLRNLEIDAANEKVAIVGENFQTTVLLLTDPRFLSTLPTTVVAMPAKPMVPKVTRRPVPDEPTTLKADAEVRATYKDEFAKKLPADKRRLAEKLLTESAQTADPAGKFAMLNAAISLAADAGDINQISRVAEQMQTEFEMDVAMKKVIAVETLARANANIITPKALAEGAVEMAEEMLAHDEYEAALRLLSVADNAFLRANLAPSARELEARIPLIKKQREAFEPIRQAAQKLKTTPDDPAASTLVGRYRCFVQRRWEEGLKLLVVGNDAVLKKLAEQDVNIDTDLTDLKRGDAWAEYATSLTDTERA